MARAVLALIVLALSLCCCVRAELDALNATLVIDEAGANATELVQTELEATNATEAIFQFDSNSTDSEEARIRLHFEENLAPNLTEPFFVVDTTAVIEEDYGPIYSKFPQKFALKSFASGRYLSVLPTDDNRVVVKNSYADDWEAFQAVDASLISDKVSAAKTIIAIRSLATGKFLSAVDPAALASSRLDVDEAESFIVYYGSQNRIALRSKTEQQFMTADEVNQAVAMTPGFLSDHKVFEVVSLDDEQSRKRKLLEKPISIRAMTSRRYVRVSEDPHEPIRANSDFNDRNETLFHIIPVANSTVEIGENGTQVGFKSVLTGKFLSLNEDDEVLEASGERLGENERFEIHFHAASGSKIVGIRSMKNNYFVCAYANKNKPLQVDRKKFREWEMFEIILPVDRSLIPLRIALRSIASNKYLHVDEQDSRKALHANSDHPGFWESFEPVFLSDSLDPTDKNGTIVGFKSLATNKFVSARFNETKLYAEAVDFHYTEMFELHYIGGNVIGLKSKAKKCFVCANPNEKKPLVADREEIWEWEMFEIVPI